MIEAWRNAACLGLVALLLVVVARLRGAWRIYPVLLLLGAAAAWYLGALAPGWALQSLRDDAPWLLALVLALWTATADGAWLRARGWLPVVLLTAVFGGRLVAVGLAASEPDPTRRARLVLAASGASLLGLTSGAAPLVLGWGGREAVVLGLVLAAVGFAPGKGGADRAPFDRKAALAALVVPLGSAVVAWLCMLGGGLELVATALEQLPYQWMPHSGMFVLGGSLLAGVIGDMGTFAVLGHEVLARGLSLRGDEVEAAMRAGLVVGGGLPLLVLTRSRLAVGLPLWLVQVGVVAAWFWFR